ncbi:MAG: DoxX family protein [Bacteroidales bacterium]|nr:DoxX family protein [Bacteroidales bacterium]
MKTTNSNKKLNIALWIAQSLLAAMFLMTGVMKLTSPIETLAESLPWVTSVPVALIRFIGLSEFLGGLGLLLPSILKIKPQLTVWAARGLTVVMALAAIFHGSRGEFSAIGMNVVLLAIAVFIFWGRSKKAPIQTK